MRMFGLGTTRDRSRCYRSSALRHANPTWMGSGSGREEIVCFTTWARPYDQGGVPHLEYVYDSYTMDGTYVGNSSVGMPARDGLAEPNSRVLAFSSPDATTGAMKPVQEARTYFGQPWLTTPVLIGIVAGTALVAGGVAWQVSR